MKVSFFIILHYLIFLSHDENRKPLPPQLFKTMVLTKPPSSSLVRHYLDQYNYSMDPWGEKFSPSKWDASSHKIQMKGVNPPTSQKLIKGQDIVEALLNVKEARAQENYLLISLIWTQYREDEKNFISKWEKVLPPCIFKINRKYRLCRRFSESQEG